MARAPKPGNQFISNGIAEPQVQRIFFNQKEKDKKGIELLAGIDPKEHACLWLSVTNQLFYSEVMATLTQLFGQKKLDKKLRNNFTVIYGLQVTQR